jgi:hypothetical protein
MTRTTNDTSRAREQTDAAIPSSTTADTAEIEAAVLAGDYGPLVEWLRSTGDPRSALAAGIIAGELQRPPYKVEQTGAAAPMSTSVTDIAGIEKSMRAGDFDPFIYKLVGSNDPLHALTARFIGGEFTPRPYYHVTTQVRHAKAALEYMTLRNEGVKYESAIEEIKAKHGMSDSTVEAATRKYKKLNGR